MEYLVTATYEATGKTTITVAIEAESKEEAIELMREGDGEFIEEVPELQINGNPYNIEVEVNE